MRRTLVVVSVLMCCSAGAWAQGQLTIVTDSLPPLKTGELFHVTLQASGGTPPYHWLADSKLPEGISLSHDGVLSGRPAKGGTFDVTVVVLDSGHPAKRELKTLHATVAASLVFTWLESPKVHNDRIDGSLQVSNGTKDEFDLTVIVEAVAENGRATAIGYEHFPLEAGAENVPINFGSTLPNGAYMVHADAIAEIAERDRILRQSLQTPQPLRVAVGP